VKYVAAIVITEVIYSNIVGHCLSDWPREACGALFGESADETTMRITGSMALANVARDPHHHFQMDPREWISLLSGIGEKGTSNLDGSNSTAGASPKRPRLAGIYHSHPQTSSLPSSEDLDTAWRRLPCFLIISLQNPDQPSVQAFSFDQSPAGYREYAIITA
jgi:proteasome lid subunit RPN8/RPN11